MQKATICFVSILCWPLYVIHLCLSLCIFFVYGSISIIIVLCLFILGFRQGTNRLLKYMKVPQEIWWKGLDMLNAFANGACWVRKVQREQPLPPPKWTKRRPSQVQPTAQRQSSFLSKLPLELRQMIYRQLYQSDVHVVVTRPETSRRYKVDAYQCYAWHEDRPDSNVRRNAGSPRDIPGDQRTDYGFFCDCVIHQSGTPGIGFFQQSCKGILSPLLTCRQIYQESIVLLYCQYPLP